MILQELRIYYKIVMGFHQAYKTYIRQAIILLFKDNQHSNRTNGGRLIKMKNNNKQL
jgi:hypothetical protein